MVFPDQVRRAGFSLQFGDPNLHPDDAEFLRRLRDRRDVGSTLLSSFVDRYVNGLITLELAALWLTMIKCHGLGISDTRYLTRAMVESGSIFDYRPLARKRGRRMIRRYPTGAVSEKVSLILPSILVALSEHIPLMSTTLVARSLSFTGGTWDKMAIIPDFRFAVPGEDIDNILEETRVALCTTTSEVCPADRALYTLRSLTGNVVSKPLIISSICSKHLALPVDRILMDVRFGPGAFIMRKEDALDLGSAICRLFDSEGISSEALMIGTESPTGTAVGNAVEVVEAIAVMGGTSNLFVETHPAMALQREIVLQQAVRLINSEFPQNPGCDAASLEFGIEQLFETKQLLRAFCSLLQAHGVSSATAFSVCESPDRLLSGLELLRVHAPFGGSVAAIDQVRLGNYVNFGLHPESVIGSAPGRNRSGVILKKLVGETTDPGTLLAEVVVSKDSLERAGGAEAISAEVATCFRITSTPRG